MKKWIYRILLVVCLCVFGYSAYNLWDIYSQKQQVENETKQLEKKVKLIIEDNGIGIIEEDLPRVFEKSFTGYNGRTYKASTGMGLYLCKSLCLELGHDIEIESVKNKFTRIIITLQK